MPKLKSKIFELETKIQNLTMDRNGNYYKTIVREFFPSQSDLYRGHIGEHDCFCNCCGEDLAYKSQNLAEEKFNLFKSEFESKQVTNISGESHTVSDKQLQDL